MDSIFLYSPRVALVYPIFLINQAFSLKFNRIFKNFLPAKPPFFATSTPRSPPPAPFDKKIIFTHHDRKIPPRLPLRGRFRLLGFGMKNAKKTPQPNHLRPSRARKHASARIKPSSCIHEDQHSPLLAQKKICRNPAPTSGGREQGTRPAAPPARAPSPPAEAAGMP